MTNIFPRLSLIFWHCPWYVVIVIITTAIILPFRGFLLVIELSASLFSLIIPGFGATVSLSYSDTTNGFPSFLIVFYSFFCFPPMFKFLFGDIVMRVTLVMNLTLSF